MKSIRVVVSSAPGSTGPFLARNSALALFGTRNACYRHSAHWWSRGSPYSCSTNRIVSKRRHFHRCSPPPTASTTPRYSWSPEWGDTTAYQSPSCLWRPKYFGTTPSSHPLPEPLPIPHDATHTLWPCLQPCHCHHATRNVRHNTQLRTGLPLTLGWLGGRGPWMRAGISPRPQRTTSVKT